MPNIAVLNMAGEEVGKIKLADSVFAEGDSVDVTGISKGKGYQGTIKRHGQSRIPMSHGAGPVHRSAGSMGACSSPSRVFKGKKLPGHYGNVKKTIQNLYVAKVDGERNLILVKGGVPGPKGGLLVVKEAIKSGK